MTLAELLEPRGVEAQLYPLLEKVGARKWDYKRKLDETTKNLAEAGYLVRPAISGNTKQDIESALEAGLNLGEGQHLLLDSSSPLFPDDEKRFSKLPLLSVPRYQNLSVENKKLSNWNLQNRLINSLTRDGTYAGVDFQGRAYGDYRLRCYRLVDDIRAHIAAKDDSLEVKITDYTPDNFNNPLLREGANFIVEGIPSFNPDEEGPYEFVVTQVPIIPRSALRKGELTLEQASQTYNLDTSHICKKYTPHLLSRGRNYRTTEGVRKTKELLLDHHVILAYLLYQDSVNNGELSDKKDFKVPNLFYKPDQEMTTLFWNLYSNTLKETSERGHVVRNPLDLIDIETSLWHYIAYRNRKNL